MAAFAAAVQGDGGPFNVPNIADASGYATIFFTGSVQRPTVLLAGFELDASHLVPISDEALDYGDPAITASDVVDRATLKAFVTAAGEYIVELLESDDPVARSNVLAKARVTLRDPNGPWRDGSVYLSVHGSRQQADPVSRRVSRPVRAATGRDFPATSRPAN